MSLKTEQWILNNPSYSFVNLEKTFALFCIEKQRSPSLMHFSKAQADSLQSGFLVKTVTLQQSEDVTMPPTLILEHSWLQTLRNQMLPTNLSYKLVKLSCYLQIFLCPKPTLNLQTTWHGLSSKTGMFAFTIRNY